MPCYNRRLSANEMRGHMPASKKIGTALGLIGFIILFLSPAPEGLAPAPWRLCAVLFWILCWWMFEVIPIYVTALLPIVLFPVLGIQSLKATTHVYGHPIVYLFLGGFVMALAMERWQLHKRIALTILRLVGNNTKMICAGFMCVTAFISMWMSNTATTIMMLPIATSVLHLLDQHQPHDKKDYNFSIALLLIIAFSANIGGTATLIGTPPNAIFAGFISDSLKQTVTFSDWFCLVAPFALFMLLVLWGVVCCLVFPPKIKRIESFHDLIEQELKALGEMSTGERLILVIFVATVISWFTRSHWPFIISDPAIAVASAIACFLIPVPGAGRALLKWEDTKDLPWGILLLFGGGLTIAAAMSHTKLVNYVGGLLGHVYHLNANLFLLFIIFVTIMLTELMSNMALISVFLPIILGISMSLKIDYWLLLVSATIAASYAFMLPMGTPPNAIVFASGRISIKNMIKAGVCLNILASLLLYFYASHYMKLVMPFKELV